MGWRNRFSTKIKINLFLIIIWTIPLFFFVPSDIAGLKPADQHFALLHDSGISCSGGYCFTALPSLIGYGHFADLMMPYFHYDNYEYHVTYTLNPHWKYWLLVVGILLIITLYLRRDLLIKLHKATGLFIVIGYSIIFVACNTNNKKDDKPLPQNFNELTFLEITALPNGNAYAKSLDGGLWYLKGAEAIKVREVCQIISDTTRGRGFAHPYDETDPLGVKSKKKY